MPNKSSTRWISDGESMAKEFQGLGYDVDLQFAEDDIPTQLSQIENMLTKGAKVLVIASIDGTTLTDVLQRPMTRAPRCSPMTASSAARRTSTITPPSTTSKWACCRLTRSSPA